MLRKWEWIADKLNDLDPLLFEGFVDMALEIDGWLVEFYEIKHTVEWRRSYKFLEEKYSNLTSEADKIFLLIRVAEKSHYCVGCMASNHDCARCLLQHKLEKPCYLEKTYKNLVNELKDECLLALVREGRIG